MTIKDYSSKFEVSNRTVQRWISKFNKENGTSFPSGVNSTIDDPDLIEYLLKKGEKDKKAISGDIKGEVGNSLVGPGSVIERPVTLKTAVPVKKKRKKLQVKKGLQQKLSKDWLIIVVITVILWVDMFAFGAIGNHEFSSSISFAWFFFAIIGLATGFGSVVTYNRIADEALAKKWKVAFGVLQYLVFMFVVNDLWFWAESVMTLMVVVVFVGVQRSIKG